MLVGEWAPAAPVAPGAPVEVRLLDGFEVRIGGRPVELSNGPQRIVALLALHERGLQRNFVAGTLWPDSPDDNAKGRLRSALWRMHRREADVVEARGPQLGLPEGTRVDVVELMRTANRLGAGERVPDVESLAGAFNLELLPDWYDDWVLEWRERWRQLRLHALECLAGLLVRLGSPHRAVEAGLAAVRAEPLRESAHRALIEVHLAEGNFAEVVHHYERYRKLLDDELGIGPSPLLTSLIEERIR